MNKIIEHYYEVKSEKIKPARIVLLSDIHYYEKKECFKLDAIAEHVLKLKPNYIAIVGDLLDEAYVSDLEYVYNWIVTLSNYATVLISIGNHDLFVKDNKKGTLNKEFFQSLSNITNVKVLDDTSFVENNICFAGLTMPASYYYEVKEPKEQLISHLNLTFPMVDKNNFNVLLCHTPLRLAKKEVLEKIDIHKNLDLILFGHTHGGITPECLKPILKGIGIISPLRKLFFRNAYGHKICGDTNMIISSGVTKAGHRNKFHKLDFMFAREITVIDIKK